MVNRFMGPIAIVLTIAVVVLGATSVYNSWVSSSLHSKSCARNDLILDTMHDLVVLFFTPPKGETLTAAQVKRITAVEGLAFVRIDQARC